MTCLTVNNFIDNLMELISVSGGYLPPLQNMIIVNYFTYMCSVVTARSLVFNFCTALFQMFLEITFDISTKMSTCIGIVLLAFCQVL